MRLLLYRFRFYLISGSMHVFFLILLTFVSFQEIRPTPSFQTSVYFESEKPRLSTRKKGSKSKSVSNKTRNKKPSKPAPSAKKMTTTRAQTGVVLKPNKQIPFLKSNNRIARLQSTEELEKIFKRKDYDIPLEKQKHPAPDIEDSQPAATTKNGRLQRSSTGETRTTVYRQKNTESSTGTTNSAKIWQKKNDLVAYRNVLGKLITANWVVPPVSIRKFTILIEAYIDPKGNLIVLKLLNGSGLAILDAAAERAIRVSTPFPEYPASFGAKTESFKAVFRFTPDRVGI